MTSILKADTIQDTDGNNIINESSNTITIGASGDTITIPSGATITNSGTATGFGELNKPAFYATRSGAQSISNNTYTKLQVNTEVVDTNSAYDNSSNYRFTVPSGEAGLYSFAARSSLANVNDDQRGQIVLAVNGTRDSKTMHRDYSTGADQALYVGTTGIFNLSVGDYVEVFVLQNSGGTEDADNNFFAGYKICTV